MKVDIWMVVWVVIWLRPLALKGNRLILKWRRRRVTACHAYYLLWRESSMIAWVDRWRICILLMHFGLMNINPRRVTTIIVVSIIWTVHRRWLISIVAPMLLLISTFWVLHIIHLLSSNCTIGEILAHWNKLIELNLLIIWNSAMGFKS